jgi:hypothetical protein
MEGPAGLGPADAGRFLRFMKFPSLASLEDYTGWLTRQGCAVMTRADTGRFPAYMPLYLDMVERQLTYDALKVIGFNAPAADALLGEMRFMRTLADQGRIIQGLIIARAPA